MTSEDVSQVVTGALISVAEMVDEETKKAYNDVWRVYGTDYARGWLAGREQAVAEIRAL